MSNINSIISYVNGTKRNQIQPIALASAVESAFQLTTDTGTTAAVLSVPLQNAILGSTNGTGVNGNAAILVPPFGPGNNIPDGVNAPYFNSSSFDLGRPFNVRLIGTVATGTGAANTITLYLGSSVAILGTTAAVLGTATVPVSTTGNFYLNFQIRWDAVTAAVSGFFGGQVANAAPIAATALAHATAALTPSALSFVASVTAGAASTGTVQLSEFSLEQV